MGAVPSPSYGDLPRGMAPETEGSMSPKKGSTSLRPGALQARLPMILAGLALLLISMPFWGPLAFSLPPEKACIVCHEMREVVFQWKESGSADQHGSCTDCHFDRGPTGLWEKDRTALTCLVVHFTREADTPLQAPPEPLFLDLGRDPAYYSSVPNRRCYQCKDIRGHSPIEQQTTHELLIAFPVERPCKDCHNHEMRNGQKFYEKILPP